MLRRFFRFCDKHEAAIAAWATFAIIIEICGLVLLIASAAFAQPPTPPPTWTPNPTYPSGGGWTNPSNWSSFVQAVTIPGFFAILFFCALAYVWWKGKDQPSNKNQVRLLRLMVQAATARHEQTKEILRGFVAVVSKIGEKLGVDVAADSREIFKTINQPPPLDSALLLDLDDKNGKD